MSTAILRSTFMLIQLSIARELLMEADLPIFFRAGCSLVLADNGYERV